VLRVRDAWVAEPFGIGKAGGGYGALTPQIYRNHPG
jgi:hypothetical protein